jgi:hypothetical protein
VGAGGGGRGCGQGVTCGGGVGCRFSELASMLRLKSTLASIVTDLGGAAGCDTPNSMAVCTPSMTALSAPSPLPGTPR